MPSLSPGRKRLATVVMTAELWRDEMFRALSALFWCGARAVRVAMQDRLQFQQVLRCAVRTYADRDSHSNTRNSAGLFLQNLSLTGPESRSVLEMALDAGPLPSAIVYWMWPSSVPLDARRDQRRDTTLQAAQLACNFCKIRAAVFVKAGVLAQVMHVLVQLYDDPPVLAVLVNVLLVVLTQIPPLARLVAGTSRGI